MPTLTYPTSDFVPYTKILSADVNGKFNAIKTLLNTTKLDSTNVQQYGLTRDRLAAGTANHVVINDSSGYMSSEAQLATTRGGIGFSPTLSAANAGKTVGVNDAGNALELRTPEASLLAVNFANTVSTLKAGEAISIRDAVCLKLNEGAYKLFKADADGTDTNSTFFGFALQAATVTSQISTIAISPANWTSGTATITVNGRVYSQAFSTDHNTSVDALAVQIQGDVDVLSCVASGSPRSLLTITGEGGLTLTIAVTANPTGATFGTPNTTQSPAGDAIRVQYLGALAGFSSLTVGDLYYLSSTAGSITNAPSDSSATYVGQAIATDTLLINPNKFNYVFQQSNTFIKTGGLSDPTNAANTTTTTEHFNLSSWSAGTAVTVSKAAGGYGESSLGGLIYAIRGHNAGTVGDASYSYNKSSWSSITATSQVAACSACATLGSTLISAKGNDNGGGFLAKLYTWNGSAWANPGDMTNNSSKNAGFVVGSVFSALAGYNAGNHNYHNTYNGASFSTATNYPETNASTFGSRTTGSKGIAGGLDSNSTNTYEWNGSSWSAAIALTASVSNSGGNDIKAGAGGAGYFSGAAVAVINGGSTSAPVAMATTQKYNGSSWSSATSSSNARSTVMGGVA